jgi:hypothetical protein
MDLTRMLDAAAARRLTTRPRTAQKVAPKTRLWGIPEVG